MLETGVQTRPQVAVAGTERAPDAEALFEEARRRRRRRRTAIVLAVAVVLIAAVIGLELSTHGPSSAPARSPRVVHPGSTSGSASQAAPVAYDPAIQIIGQADAQTTWAAGTSGIYISTDGGISWLTVTPPNLTHLYVSQYVNALDAVGTDDLWLPLYGVPGLVPYAQSTDGSDRGEGIDRSTDGGKTWTFSTLPNCSQWCGPIWLSFVNSQVGFAAVSAYGSLAPQGEPAMLFSTQDGGATWSEVTTPPDLGSVSVGGPIASPQMVFTTVLDGWAVTGPTEGKDGVQATPGGRLYRTTDGGRSWSIASGLPAHAQYSLPTFFSPDQGVVLSNPLAKTSRGQSVYVTHNAGRTWSRRGLPTLEMVSDRAGDYYKGSSLETLFSAVSTQKWTIDQGVRLYRTTDGGRQWTSFVPSDEWDVSSAEFTSTGSGTAVALPLQCLKPVPSSQRPATDCYGTLIVTSDGGDRWAPAKI